MFKITRGKGSHITFENGYSISVQFGCGNYCDLERTEELGNPSSNAEIAILKDGELIHVPGWDNEVKGYCSPEEVLKWMNYVYSISKDDQYE